jgi:hypothetical protein
MMPSNLELLNVITKFNNFSLEEKADILTSLSRIVDDVANGVWDNERTEHRQCHFCCRSPESEHMDFCVVELARKFREKYLGYTG